MITEVMSDSQFRLVFDYGVDLDGNPIKKNKNFNNVKTTATPDGLYTIAQSLAPLQQHAVLEIGRNNSYMIFDDGTAA